MKPVSRAMCALVWLVAAQAVAADQRPWAVGVSEADQKQALDLFKEGNANLKESLFAAAVEKYERALSKWDHPAIHYNLALALQSLDRPIELYRNLEAALKYGAAPLDDTKYQNAVRLKDTTFNTHLAKLTVRTDNQASVRLDGKPLFNGPGEKTELVRKGGHSVSASADGFLPAEQSVTLAPGSTQAVEMKLVTADDVTQYKRRWSQALPYGVLLGGVAVAAGGLALHLSSQNAFKAYDRGIQECAAGATSGGCFPNPVLAGQRSSGDTMQSLGITMYVVGGAAIATGAVLLYMNRLMPYRASVGPAVTFFPILTPTAAGGALSASF